MICTKAEFLGFRVPQPGSILRAEILSENTPESLEISGSDVENMNDNDVLAPGSRIITPTAEYLAFEEGVFTQLSASGSSSGGETPR